MSGFINRHDMRSFQQFMLTQEPPLNALF